MAKKIVIEEDLLQKALVPKDKQPYEIPENWCWIYLIPGYADCLDSHRKPVNAEERASRTGLIPYYGATGQVGWIDNYLTAEQLVLIGEDGAPFFDSTKVKAYIIEGKAWVNNHAHILRSKFGHIGNFYLMNYLNYFDYHGFVNGTTRLKLTQASMNRIPIPMPPLAEQKRIVDRIESLFSKLDEVKDKVQSVLDGMEPRKAAILHKAFTGELTKKWREENDIDISTWSMCTVSSVCKSLRYGTAKKSKPTGRVVVIRMGNLQKGEIDWSDLAYSDDEDDLKKYSLVPGDVLFNRTNSAALVGKTSIYRGEYPAIYAGYLIKLDYDRSLILGDYLNYQLNGPEAKAYYNKVKTDGVNQSNINAQKIGAYPLRIASLPEQQEIVRILKSYSLRAQKVQQIIQKLQDQIEQMKSSILSKAFRGELGTNDPFEESSLNLLKQIVEKA